MRFPLIPDQPAMSYARFAAMIAVSTIVMYGLMYLNTWALDHVFFSQTRAWMALLMGAVMAVIMLGFMWSMYKDSRTNAAIVAAAAVAFAGSLWLVRSQETVSGVSYMEAMIPHHSIAVMTRDGRTSRIQGCASSQTESSKPRSGRSAR